MRVIAPLAPVHAGPSALSKHEFDVGAPVPDSATHTSPSFATATWRGLSRPPAIALTLTPG